MTRRRGNRPSIRWWLAAWLAPELVALVLSVLVIVVIALALELGPFAASRR